MNVTERQSVSSAAIVGTCVLLTDIGIRAVGGASKIPTASTFAGALAAAIATIAILSLLGRDQTDQAAKKADLESADEAQRTNRATVRSLHRDLAEITDEETLIERVQATLAAVYASRSGELHLIDRVSPTLGLAAQFGTPTQEGPSDDPSPWTSLVARDGVSIITPSTNELEICSHLRGRSADPRSAIAVPLSATGQILGVLYVFGPDGENPENEAVALAEEIASITAAHIALVRATATVSRPIGGNVDRLTGLLDLEAAYGQVKALLAAQTPFSLAVADVDGFTEFNEIHGTVAGDQALQLLARVATRQLRPSDTVARVGGDEFLFALPTEQPNALAGALQRIAEELVLEQANASAPPVTVSVGVVSSSVGQTPEDLFGAALEALSEARRQEGNRVVVRESAVTIV